MQSFVDNVGRYQRGEALSAPIGDVEDDVKPAAVSPRKQTNEAKQKPEEEHTIFGHSTTKTANAKKTKVTKAAASQSIQKKQTLAASTEPKPTKQSAPAISKEKASPAVASTVSNSSVPVPPEQNVTAAAKESVLKKSHPPQGKASVVCGCFGSLHKPLTNCLYCGRISCEREGYDFCPFCGILVEQVSGGER